MTDLKSHEISLIVTTYNSPAYLEMYLRSIQNLELLPKELIIADDGSTTETADLIKQYQADFPIKISHVWQEDKGFRAAKIRNEALKTSTGRYIIFTNGDIILHPRFITDHLQATQTDFFVQGSRILLNKNCTKKLLESKNTSLGFFSNGLNNPCKTISCRLLQRVFSRPVAHLKGIKTCNFALWRDDAFLVNGFNEEFEGWGREDTEFALRLLYAGKQRKNLRFGGIIFHLYHPENDRTTLPENDRLLEKTRVEKLKYCQKGLTKLEL